LAALKSGEAFFAHIREEFEKRRDVTYDELMKIPGAVCVRPSGAFYLMAKLPVPDIEDFASWLLTAHSLDGETTMIAPGPGFYATSGLGKSEARIAYVLNSSDLKKAMRILAKGIEVYSAQKVKV
jgi:aspartate aminotransferase